ncbi:dihydroorotate oxidase [Carnobacteriaceae bacterium zg-84]|uniref:dihydroorotate oxidase n=1 Tax=Granulicatella sp. zg-84 TaxID=2678503 RepID=UPI0013BF4CEC|nr:dihydroorotate oxidase [Granulicatella sp. zg-84]NEW66644.1 dihydroorotate oxidase [Granulicatella sp. zg-84]QMI85033.1 dihydroorotate oxidase [Carnobacteriaceae bacterium zg-84]
MNTTTSFKDYTLNSCLLNASGIHCLTVEDLNALSQSQAGAFVTKTATLHEREGNPTPRYFDTPLGSINSMGLPNLGVDVYLNYVIEYEKSHPEKPCFLSVVGMSYEETISILKKVQESDYQGMTEFNLSCPNLPGKPQIAYDFELTHQLLSDVFSFFTKPLGVKLPPYFDMAHFDAISTILNQFPLAYVNTINSIGNGLYIDVDSESVVIKPKSGFGGIGGAYVKPTALANVRALCTRLNPSIQIIGTGGVLTGQDVFEHLLCGASLVAVGTQLYKEGLGVFDRLNRELSIIMKKKGYTSIEQFRGKLKDM